MKKIFLALLLALFAAVSFYFFWLLPKHTVPILMYHNIDRQEGSFYVTPENFRRQMEYLKNGGYQVISLDELVKSIKQGRRLKKNRVVITFDDGYRDNFEYAYPVLKRLGFPATIFLISDFVGQSFDNGKEFLSWDQITEMSKNKISFGAHTKTHLYLGSVQDIKLTQEEILGAKQEIIKRTGLSVEYFCYPSGAFNEQTKELVKQGGFKGACSTNRGFAKFNQDVYELKRIKVTNSDLTKPFSFRAKLSGYYNVFKKGKNPY
jgi:peptidoglycan/xylan/chitin deacetylase (PgdA/CDA1 family)